MKLSQAIEGGLTGASTLGMLQEALHKVDPRSPRPLLGSTGLAKKLKKNGGKPGTKSAKLYVQLASELVSNAALFGLSGIGKKKNAVLRGVLLGAAAGLGSALFVKDDESEEAQSLNGSSLEAKPVNNLTRKRLMTIALYTAGGLVAGLAVKNINTKKAKRQLKKAGKKIKP